MAKRILQVVTGLVLGLAVVLVVFPLILTDEEPSDPHVLPAPYPAPSLRLTDQHGAAREVPGDFDGLTAVFFGYTHCPDVCPLTMASLAAVHERLEPDDARRLRVVLVSVDPARDTPARLEEYLAGFDPTFIGLTGSEGELREAADAWGAWAERAATPPVTGDSAEASGDPATAGGDPQEGDAEAPAGSGHEGYLVDHTARTFLVGPRGRIVATFPPSTSADAMLPTVRRLLEEIG